MVKKEIIMNLFICSIFCIFFSFLLNLNAFAEPTPVDKIIDDLASTKEIAPEVIIKLLRLQEILSNEDLSKEIASVKSIKNDQYPNGMVLKDYMGLHYPNGQIIRDYMGTHYSNGKVLKDYMGLHYPNGQVIKDYNGIHDVSGSKINAVPMIEWPPKESVKITELTKTPSTPISQIKCEIKPKTIEELKNRLLKTDLMIQLNKQLNPIGSEAYFKEKCLQLTESELKNKIRPNFIDYCKKEHNLSEVVAAEYFGELWNDPSIQDIVRLLIKG
jgi:hypothetical protein